MEGHMTTWFTSDLHLGHANIIGYCDRPVADVDEMDAMLVERWNQTVAPDDTVWVLGDVALGRITESLALVSELHGTKLLLAGNHDRCWSGHARRAEGWTERYLDAGFAEIIQGSMTLAIGAHEVVACHFPYRGDSHDLDRYVDERPVDTGAWLIHGHVHERWRQRGRMINVGSDAWGYRPVAESTLAGLIEAGAAEHEPLPAG
jgi:calcineurin-like phosphoesterase family protein